MSNTTYNFNCKSCGYHIETDDHSFIYEKGFCCGRCMDNYLYLEFAKLGTIDRGFKHDRTVYNEREKAFAEVWADECKQRLGINHGHGILQDLFMDREKFHTHCYLEITPEHRFITATAIQWLGSNCGMAFLGKALEKCGYKIVKVDD